MIPNHLIDTKKTPKTFAATEEEFQKNNPLGYSSDESENKRNSLSKKDVRKEKRKKEKQMEERMKAEMKFLVRRLWISPFLLYIVFVSYFC